MAQLVDLWRDVLPPEGEVVVVGGGFAPGGEGQQLWLIWGRFGGEVLPPEGEGQQLWLI